MKVRTPFIGWYYETESEEGSRNWDGVLGDFLAKRPDTPLPFDNCGRPVIGTERRWDSEDCENSVTGTECEDVRNLWG